MPPQVKEKLKLGMGKVRRFTLAKLRRRYVTRCLERRIGECIRCGACCELLYKCVFLKQEDGRATCRIHKLRPANCRLFPINSKDLEDRNRVNPLLRCGYKFRHLPVAKTKKNKKVRPRR